MNEQRKTSVFCVTCVCGRNVETKHEVSNCPHCKRLIQIEWRPAEVRRLEREKAA